MKTLKKAIAFVLALVMAVSVFYGTDLLMNANAETGTKVVYFDNAKTKWSNAFAYIWEGSQGTLIVKGTKVEGNIFKMEIPADYSKILFKNTENGWDKQTANTTVPTDKNNCFKPSSSSNKSSGSWYYYEDASVVTEAPVNYIPVVFNNSNTMWKQAYAYVWNNPEDYAVFEAQEVRDITMWKDEHGGWQQADRYFIYSIPNNYSHILFKNTAGTDNWDKQTVDMNMPTDNNNMFLANMYGLNGEGKYEGTWGPMPTETPYVTATPTVKPTKTPVATKTPKPTKTPKVTATPKPTKTPVVTTTPTALPKNYVKVYYKTSNSTTNIHYITSTGAWTVAPGVKMTKSGNYAYYVVDLGDRTESKACFNNGSGKWDSNNGSNYLLKSGYDAYIENGSVRYEKHPDDGKKVTVAFKDKTFNANHERISWEQQVYAYVWTSPEDYAVFEAVEEIEEWGKNSYGEWQRDDTFVFEIPARYTHILFKNLNSTTNWDKQTVDYEMPNGSNNYFIKNDVNGEGKYTGVWTTYNATPAPATPTPTPVTPAPVTPTPFNKTIVKFDNSIAKWNAVYAYVWNDTTDAKVFETTSIYNNIYTFEIIGSYSKVLFKNTPGTADWKTQTNDLEMPTGTKNIYKPYSSDNKPNGEWVDDSITPVTPTPVPGKKTIYFCDGYFMNKWENAYAYVWNNTSDFKCFEPVAVTKHEAGSTNGTYYTVYKFEIDGNYGHVLFKNLPGTTQWDKQTDDLVMPTNNETMYFYGVSGTGHQQEWWIDPSSILNMPAPSTPSPSPYLHRNICAVYYELSSKGGSSNWSSCYIHYNVNGCWTTVPGCKMQKVDNNTYFYSFELGTASEAKVCFNNAAGKWDSNNGKNYTVKTGENHVKDLKVTYGYEVTTKTTILYNNASNFGWTDVYAYAWNSPTDYEIFYPTKTYGSKFVIGKDGNRVNAHTYYQFDIPTSYANVLFKNVGTTTDWDAQTQDLVMPNTDNSCFIVDGKDWEGKLYGHWEVVSQETLALYTNAVATGAAIVSKSAA